MAEETWHAARLIPTSGISGVEEQERRATSALLAVMGAVKEFGRIITSHAGASAGNVDCFIEVPFDIGERKVYPDGLIRVRRGQRSWTALVEVKTGPNRLEREQLECYLDIAREQGFDAILTISNELSPSPGVHPTSVDKRRLKKVALHHLSWTQVLTEAVMQKVYRGVADPDQAWVLGELIRYLEHPRSGAMEFEDMGGSWVPVREAISAGTLRPTDKGVAEVASRWDQLIRYAALRLGRQLGIEVQPALSRKELAEPALRAQAVADGLTSRAVLEGGLRIPHAVGPLIVTADLRAGRLSVHVDVDAPQDGRPLTRVNWLLRQLKDAPELLRIDAFALHARTSTSGLLRDVRANPAVLVDQSKRELKSFRVTAGGTLGTKRGQGRGSFVSSVIDLMDNFYGGVVQNIKPWSAPAPKLRHPEPTEATEPGVSAALVSTFISSQDEPGTLATDEAPVESESIGGHVATASEEVALADTPEPEAAESDDAVPVVSWDFAWPAERSDEESEALQTSEPDTLEPQAPRS
ncbi:MAG: stress response protein [Acidimicrobiia bacterium]